MTIWDHHCHLDGSNTPGATLSERLEYVLRVADRMGIERLGLLLRAAGRDREIEQMLERHRRRVFCSLWMTLWNQTTEASLDQVNRWVADGPMVGIKLAGSDGVCSLPVYMPVFERAAQLRAEIAIHSFVIVGGEPPRPGGFVDTHGSRPQDVAELAGRLPETPVVFIHSGGDWELGLPAVRAARNVLVEISGSFPTRGMVEMAVREVGAERIVYGSDIGGRSFASQLAKVYGASITEREKELIFSGNLRRILTPILRTKGLL